MNKVPEYIKVLEKLQQIMKANGDMMRASAYGKAQNSLLMLKNTITSAKELKGVANIGKSIIEKLTEYDQTGTLELFENEKNNPIHIFEEVYGIGPKKAKELVEVYGITTMAELERRKNEVLNEKQQIGLLYHQDIMKRINRDEIDMYNVLFQQIVKQVGNKDSASVTIVGSYRRGELTSGDIDVILTPSLHFYNKFIDILIEENYIVEVLSRGQSKCLVIMKLHTESASYRRVDFLFSPPNEYAFAILYFTGSKEFNTAMRQHALNMGYTMNEHGIQSTTNNNKNIPPLLTEQSIFDFLFLVYKRPSERKDIKAIEVNNSNIMSMDTIERFNVILSLIAKEGVKNIETYIQDAQTFEALLNYLDDQYYNHKSIVSDGVYDLLVNIYEQKYNLIYKEGEVGAKVNGAKVNGAKVNGSKQNKVASTNIDVKLPFMLPSMDKIKNEPAKLQKWFDTFPSSEYVISAKLDGISALLHVDNGGNWKMYSRGDGEYGRDISAILPYIRLNKPIVGNDSDGIYIRGELLVQKEVFERKYKTTYATSRNFIIGVTNTSSSLNIGLLRDVDFVAYEIVSPQMQTIQQMQVLNQMGLSTVAHDIVSIKNKSVTEIISMFSSYLLDWRASYIYEIDGIIVKDNKVHKRSEVKVKYEKYAFAFKMALTDQMAETTVTDVIWTASKDGYLYPRIEYDTVEIGGSHYTYASGKNAKFIADNGIGVGSIIQIIRSGDVIPDVLAVIRPADEPKFPSIKEVGEYIWNESKVDLVLVNPQDSLTVKIKTILKFFEPVNGLSIGTVTKLVTAGQDSIKKIMTMTPKDYLKIKGFSATLTDKIYKGIQEYIANISLVELMSVSNIFGRGIGITTIQEIMTVYPNILTDTSMSKYEKVMAIVQLEGMGDKTAELFVSNIPAFSEFIKEVNLEHKLYETTVAPVQTIANTNNPLFKKSVVLSGHRDANVIRVLDMAGAIQENKVKKSTFMVIVKEDADIHSPTTKIKDALTHKIPILTIQQFMQQFYPTTS